MLPKEQYGRAAGMLSLAQAASGILAPAFAGALIGFIGLVGIMTIDVITFLIAVGALMVVHIPQPTAPQKDTPDATQSSLLRDFTVWVSIYLRKTELARSATRLFCLSIFTAMIGFSLLIPMILLRTNNNEIALASVQSVSAIGGVIGGLLLSIWGGPQKKVHGVLVGMLASSILGQALFGLGQNHLDMEHSGLYGSTDLAHSQRIQSGDLAGESGSRDSGPGFLCTAVDCSNYGTGGNGRIWTTC